MRQQFQLLVKKRIIRFIISADWAAQHHQQIRLHPGLVGNTGGRLEIMQMVALFMQFGSKTAQVFKGHMADGDGGFQKRLPTVKIDYLLYWNGRVLQPWVQRGG